MLVLSKLIREILAGKPKKLSSFVSTSIKFLKNMIGDVFMRIEISVS